MSAPRRMKAMVLHQLGGALRLEEVPVPSIGPGDALVRVRVGSAALLARLTRQSANMLQLAPGQAVWAQVKSVALME